MCGIVAIVRRPSTRPVPGAADVTGMVEAAVTALSESAAGVRLGDLAQQLGPAAEQLHAANQLSSGVPGLRLLLESPEVADTLRDLTDSATASVAALEARLDADTSLDPAELEHLNEQLVHLRDGLWALGRDRLGAAHAVSKLLAGAQLTARSSPAAVEAYLSIHQALSALDRLEVRGRDSAGLHLLISGHGLDGDDPVLTAALEHRGQDPSFGSGSVRLVDGVLSIVHKTAAEIGELGDNTAALRAAVTSDRLLAAALASADARVLVLAHTRWASIGIISEANAHPLNSELTGEHTPYVIGAINGDVDNYAELFDAAGVRVPPSITTDSKTVPALMGRRLADGLTSGEAFRRTVAECEGSVAVAVCTAGSPDRLQLALRGSGQALYVGLADDAFIVASEPYGVVEETSEYLRMDGEAVAGSPGTGRGQIVELDGSRAGLIEGVSRHSYDGAGLPVAPGEVSTASITTRDIDRGDHRHYLLKEIGEAPASFRKTLRGRIVDTADGPGLSIGPETLPESVRSGLRDGSVSKVLAIGQGTAAVAGESFARCLRTLLADAGRAGALDVTALPATELSAFHLQADMSDTLVVAISQSGTTTDTNRTVDLVRARGGSVVAVVNRRNSDLTDRADGVLYTSDGRDVEMSVASTKAFYSQVAAGCLLAVAVAGEVAGDRGAAARRSLLETLRSMPSVLDDVLERRTAIGEAARRLAPGRRHWAVVGNGPNQVAAREVRIKLSELCYMSISADATEDKKHIDLSAEPLVLVCAAGLSGSIADDVAKEVAIFGAHRAAPVVVADDGDTRFEGASAVLPVPKVDPRLAFLPATMVGHLFGYEAALAIDAGAQPLREARAAIEASAARPDSTAEDVLSLALPTLRRSSAAFSAGLQRGDYNGHLEASTAVRIVTLMRYAVGLAPLDGYELELGRIGTPEAVIDDLEAALSVGIDELTRPVDAIRHQAKTVTVGISRSDQTLLEAPLIRAVLATGAPRDNLSYSTIRALADLSGAVAEVLGHTRYQLDGVEGIAVVDQGGIATQITSRTASAPSLTGSKRRVAGERRVLAARGRHDGRTVVFVPEVAAGATVGITLLHVRFEDSLPAPVARSVLQGYRNRYSELRDAVTETEPAFDEDRLAEIPAIDLLTSPIGDLADHWRT
ncbi:MAG: SIS domain-containing protein [Acidimicrobiaceae bacterium]|nr:SIS domain-containing protein [Acidimicrobiaceae bacterium]MXZ95383.1 SIS domain-containing protein [Acidimicrobiaceae bacterium]MYF44678.1 SIS domain-containing protein [Acidimicrobiaceae bacterium]MYJ36458.1 SIS domain-containing protein [Acidimicrobiaceae bacterium]